MNCIDQILRPHSEAPNPWYQYNSLSKGYEGLVPILKIQDRIVLAFPGDSTGRCQASNFPLPRSILQR
jgi:hypothetical protein